MKNLVIAVALGAMALTTAAPTFAQPVAERQHDQEQRIRQGERTGELSPGEAHRLQARHRSIHRETDRMRARDGGGPLTHRQRARIEARQNRESGAIYHDRHDGPGN